MSIRYIAAFSSLVLCVPISMNGHDHKDQDQKCCEHHAANIRVTDLCHPDLSTTDVAQVVIVPESSSEQRYPGPIDLALDSVILFSAFLIGVFIQLESSTFPQYLSAVAVTMVSSSYIGKKNAWAIGGCIAALYAGQYFNNNYLKYEL